MVIISLIALRFTKFGYLLPEIDILKMLKFLLLIKDLKFSNNWSRECKRILTRPITEVVYLSQVKMT